MAYFLTLEICYKVVVILAQVEITLITMKSSFSQTRQYSEKQLMCELALIWETGGVLF